MKIINIILLISHGNNSSFFRIRCNNQYLINCAFLIKLQLEFYLQGKIIL